MVGFGSISWSESDDLDLCLDKTLENNLYPLFFPSNKAITNQHDRIIMDKIIDVIQYIDDKELSPSAAA